MPAESYNPVFDLRRDLYQHIQRMSLSFFERQRIGAPEPRGID